MNFQRWLRTHERRDDHIGDLARDMARDGGMSRQNASLKQLYRYMSHVGASENVRRTLVTAYREWQSCGYTYRETRDDKRRPRVPRHGEGARSDGWLSLRFLILRRDGYQCQICGRTAQDGVRLEVDHRTARSRHGSNNPDNLWTLCFDCNRGKSDDTL